MGLPCRHRSADLWSEPILPSLPVEWNGAIMYLDRDGVLNIGSENYINSPTELVLLDGAASALGALRRAGYRICLVTNQSPVGRGLWTHETLESIHDALLVLLVEQDSDAILDLILYSPYAPRESSLARKPAPGMLRAGNVLINWAENGEPPAQNRLDLRGRDGSWPEHRLSAMVGDRLVDYRAGMSHQVRTYLVDAGLGLSMVIDRLLDENDNGDHLF